MSGGRVVISGLGFISPIGNDYAEVAASLRDLRHGIEQVEWFPGCVVRVAGKISGFDLSSMNRNLWKLPAAYPFARETLRSMPPHGVYALCALEQAIADARMGPDDVGSPDAGLFCASGGSPRFLHHHLAEAVESNGQRLAPLGVISSISGTLNFNLAAHYKVQGAVTGFSSACAASTHALGYAYNEIASGQLRRALVVGAEEPVWQSLLPFAGMRALTKDSDPGLASRPFDRSRSGFVGAGGAAALVVENAEDARARGAHIYAEVAGWGQSADGYNVAIPEPTGRGLELAIRRALERSGVSAEEVDYINAHATSTPVGDKAEAMVIERVFGSAPSSPLVSSTKGLTGHTLSMSGALEVGFCAIALREGMVPGNAGLVELDPDLPALNFPRTTISKKVDVILKNSSGFGGSNVCVVLRRWRE